MTVLDTHVTLAQLGSFSIGELSLRTGVSQRSLRYYEAQGLLEPMRTPLGHRRFDAADVVRVRLVQRLFGAGLSSGEIAPLLPALLGEAGADGGAVEELRAHRRRLGEEIDRLRDTAEILDEVIEGCDGLG